MLYYFQKFINFRYLNFSVYQAKTQQISAKSLHRLSQTAIKQSNHISFSFSKKSNPKPHWCNAIKHGNEDKNKSNIAKIMKIDTKTNWQERDGNAKKVSNKQQVWIISYFKMTQM